MPRSGAAQTRSETAAKSGPYRFGAKGDGLADDTPALKSVFEASGHHFVNAGTFRLKSKVRTLGHLTLVGESRQTTILASAGFPDYMIEVGDGLTSPNAGAIERLRFYGTAANTGVLHMNRNCHMWRLNDLVFSPSDCPALVVDDCWDSNYTNIDILRCAGRNADPAHSASVILRGNCNNLYFRGLRIESALAGALYVEGGPIYVDGGKIDNGFETRQSAPAITIARTGSLSIDHAQLTGVLDQYHVDLAGALSLGNVLFDGASGRDAAIHDRRAWRQINPASVRGAARNACGPTIPELDLGRAVFRRSSIHHDDTTPAAVHSRIYPIRHVANLAVRSVAATGANALTVRTSLVARANDLYKGLYLVHNQDGYLSRSRRRVLASYSDGRLVLAGAERIVVDDDYSLEFSGQHATPIRADAVSLDAGQTLFAKLARGVRVASAPAYQRDPRRAAYGLTTFALSGVEDAANRDLAGYYLIDEANGTPYYIGYGARRSSIGVMYDVTAFLDRSHRYSIVAGYAADVQIRGGVAVWWFGGKQHHASIADLEAAGFDAHNVPLWGFDVNGGAKA